VSNLDALLDRWRASLAAWAIPEHITAAVAESPWVLPRQAFARRADRVRAAPSGPSFERAWAALDPPGSVLDVGSGAGAASLPLLPRATSLTAVDSDAEMLERLSERAAPAGIPVAEVLGTWPETAARAGAADVTLCHHVLYNVADLRPFLDALTGSARRLVVAELTARHPLTALNDLWLRFHGLERPVSPTAADLLEILEAMGLRPEHRTWHRPGARDYAGFDEFVDVTRRRLCLPPERAGEVSQALVESGVDPDHPVDLASSGREVLTIWWNGMAGGDPSPTVLDVGAF
jgi:SAM-dependent methyltransferase